LQISAISSPFAETSDLFETGGTKGLPADTLRRLPAIKITGDNAVDSAGEPICCSVCLQVGYSPNPRLLFFFFLKACTIHPTGTVKFRFI
jgi:hypothetical protein